MSFSLKCIFPLVELSFEILDSRRFAASFDQPVLHFRITKYSMQPWETRRISKTERIAVVMDVGSKKIQPLRKSGGNRVNYESMRLKWRSCKPTHTDHSL